MFTRIDQVEALWEPLSLIASVGQYRGCEVDKTYEAPAMAIIFGCSEMHFARRVEGNCGAPIVIAACEPNAARTS